MEYVESSCVSAETFPLELMVEGNEQILRDFFIELSNIVPLVILLFIDAHGSLKHFAVLGSYDFCGIELWMVDVDLVLRLIRLISHS